MRWLHRLPTLTEGDVATLLASTHPGITQGLPGKVVIIGATHIGEDLAKQCSALGIRVLGIFDDSPARQGTIVAGHTVQASDELDRLERHVPVVLATHRLLGLTHRLSAAGFMHIWPFALLHCAWPEHFTPHPFYAGMQNDLLNNAHKLALLDERLADQLSRRTLDAVIAFRLTLDVRHLEPVLQPHAYFPPDIVELGPQETYVDGGAYSGDTIRHFLQRTHGRYRHIVAFEPSPGSHAALEAAFADQPAIRCIKACLYACDTHLSFNGTDARDATISSDAASLCPALCIDSLPEAPHVTVIKLNIEGAEADALFGARTTIARNTPTLAVAAYHRAQDLWQLAEIIQDMQPSYTFSLRQHDGGIIETVAYATPPNPHQRAHEETTPCKSCS